MIHRPDVVVFDDFETLADLEPLAARLGKVGQPAALLGIGITRRLFFQSADEIAARRLVTVLEAVEPPASPVRIGSSTDPGRDLRRTYGSSSISSPREFEPSRRLRCTSVVAEREAHRSVQGDPITRN